MLGLFDNTILAKQKHGGISRYWKEILTRLIHDLENPVDEFIFLGPSPFQGHEAFSGNVRTLRISEYLLFSKRRKSGFCHTPYLWLPWTRNIPTIITVHDLLPLSHPTKRFKDSLRASVLSSSIKRADSIIAVSQATKDDILSKFEGISERRIQVVHHGLSQAFLSNEPPPFLKQERPFLLYVGGRGGYKNFMGLLQSYSSSKLPRDFDLRVVGGGVPNRLELSCIHDLKIADKVIFVRAQSDSTLKAIYQSAHALIYPSEAEGFGFPLLEALASRCPAICFRQSSMKEIAGEFGVWLDELTPQGLENAVDKASHMRSSPSIELAMKYARDFSWDAAYKQHKSIYTEACA